MRRRGRKRDYFVMEDPMEDKPEAPDNEKQRRLQYSGPPRDDKKNSRDNGARYTGPKMLERQLMNDNETK